MDLLEEKRPANNVWIIDKAFPIPQLNRYRRIWLYLPEGYSKSKKHYPVLYMQDGQNLFEEWSAFSEEWQVDEALNAMRGQCIVVGIDNGVDKRLNEYTLHDHEKYGQAEGNAYLSFLVQTLKPFIDKTYRTKTGREHTYIAGSSMGGLISFYACLYYPQVFGGGGIFSPAFWIAPSLKEETVQMLQQNTDHPQRFYFYYGEKEGSEMVDEVEPVIQLIQENGTHELHKIVNAEGDHSEGQWRNQFPHFYEWIINVEH